MTKRRPPYPLEFRRQMVELVRAGRSPEELAQEFEPTAPSMRNWVGRAECDGDGLTTAERDELAQLRRENRQLRLERDILSNRCGPAPPGYRNGQSLYSAAEVSGRPLFGGSRPRSQTWFVGCCVLAIGDAQRRSLLGN